MKIRNYLLVILLAAAVLAGLPTIGQQASAGPDAPALTSMMKQEAIEGLIKMLSEQYVFPEVAKKMETDLRDRLKKGDYSQVQEGDAFAKLLTEHVQGVSKDKHLRVRFHKTPLSAEFGRGRTPTPEEVRGFEREMQRENGGFEKVERLAGNVGYMDFRFFGSTPTCFAAVDAAFSFLRNADAMIIDMRRNGGGDPVMVAYVCSYLFGDRPVHLNDLYFRPADATRQFWTTPAVPGPKFLDKPVYVLTSSRTFSGAEEFSYNLKNLKRATIVGETTGGGAHPGGTRRLSDHFSAFISTGRAISPITKTNWEGTGVKPDIEAKSDDALKVAHAEAVKRLLEKATDPEDKTWLQGVLERLQKG
jgi:retinol-binding protein 3